MRRTSIDARPYPFAGSFAAVPDLERVWPDRAAVTPAELIGPRPAAPADRPTSPR